MSFGSFIFSLPERLKRQRPEGQHDSSVAKQKAKKAKIFYHDDDQLQSDIHLPQASIYDDQINRVSNPLAKASKNALSIIGVLPHQFDLVQEYFQKHGLNPNYVEGGTNFSHGNWIIAIFDTNIENIDCIKPTIQIAPHLIVGCFMGYFQKEECEPIPDKKANKSGKPESLFKIPPLDENLTTIPFENKSYLTLFREFVLGEQDIPRKQGTIPSIFYSLFH
ncbi:hypothetical protein TRFO_31016 [Tritrichomonas foetus]|uniref:Uncharacterized protein n=1 Tax=Tritrichomonas foetus TaxID=1144522 RepID=A0A1J4JWT6_9EUKA|nr:hypothetical protein TRFO_31016 [Tritrichomonas foetus]|eukprot:OHT01998.1 hypothetical protein TRFO_31016 [Tritrichomonas foetus]